MNQKFIEGKKGQRGDAREILEDEKFEKDHLESVYIPLSCSLSNSLLNFFRKMITYINQKIIEGHKEEKPERF